MVKININEKIMDLAKTCHYLKKTVLLVRKNRTEIEILTLDQYKRLEGQRKVYALVVYNILTLPKAITEEKEIKTILETL